MEDMKYRQLRERLADVNDPLFGGSLAYLTIDTTLSLLLKLLKIKAKKDVERKSTFEKLDMVIESVRKDAYEYIEKDAQVFAYMLAHKNENIDEFLSQEAYKLAAMIDNLQTIAMYVSYLTTEIKGSLRHDFIMIRENINSSRENLKGIFKYEVSKIKEDELRGSLEALVLAM